MNNDPGKKNKAVFLDRDGVLNQEMGDYVCKLDDFHVLEHNFPALKNLYERGYMLIVVTNQGGIAKGWYTLEQLEEMHQHLRDLYKKQGVEFTAIYFCPHHPNFTGDCDCRKPKSGMFRDAIRKYNIDPAQSFLIGDRERDVEAAENVGVKGILIHSDQPIGEVLGEIA